MAETSDELMERLSGSDPVIDRMHELADMIRARSPGYVSYEGGTGQWLFTVPPDPDDPLQPGGTGQLCWMDAGQEFAVHVHDGETEVLMVIGGRLLLTVEGESPPESVLLNPGDPRRLLPGERHQVQALADVIVVGITVPRAGGYPSGPDGIEPGPDQRVRG